jgi:hypothetical protein
MSEPAPSIPRRIILAFAAFWRILLSPRFAAEVARLRAGVAAEQPRTPPAVRQRLVKAEPNAGLQLLGLLQQEGRFVDFLQEDVRTYSDAEIGAAARVVHEGCGKLVEQLFTIESIRQEPEGARLTLEEGFDSATIRLTGNLVGQAPFSGTLTHRGWRITEVRMPQVSTGHDLAIVAPAEVEL